MTFWAVTYIHSSHICGTHAYDFNRHHAGITCLLATGKYLYSAGKDVKILEWDTLNWTPVREFSGHLDIIRCLLGFGSSFLWSGSDDSSIRVWDLREEGGAKSKVLAGHQAPVTSLVSSTTWKISETDGTLVCRFWSASADKTIRVWNAIGTLECICSIDLSPSPIYSLLAVGINKVWVATDTGISIYDASNFRNVKSISSPSSSSLPITAVTRLSEAQEISVKYIWSSTGTNEKISLWKLESWVDVHDTDRKDVFAGRGKAMDILAHNIVLESQIKGLADQKKELNRLVDEMQGGIKQKAADELRNEQSALLQENELLLKKLQDIEDVNRTIESNRSDLIMDIERLKRDRDRLQEKIEQQGKEIADILESNARIVRLNRDQFERIEEDRKAEFKLRMGEYESVLTKSKNAFEDEMKKLKQQHKKELEIIIKKYEDENSQILNAHRKELDRLEISNAHISNTTREQHRKEAEGYIFEIQKLKEEHQQLLISLAGETQDNLARLDSDYKAEIKFMKVSFEGLLAEKEEEIETLQSSKKEEISKLNQRHGDELKRERQRHEIEKSTVVDSLSSTKDKEIQDLKTQIDRIKDQHKKELRNREEDYRLQRRQMEYEVKDKEDNWRRLLRDKDLEIRDLKEDIQNQSEKQRKVFSDSDERIDKLKRQNEAELTSLRKLCDKQIQEMQEKLFEEERCISKLQEENASRCRNLEADIRQLDESHLLQISDLIRTIDQLKHQLNEAFEDAQRREEELRSEFQREIRERDDAVKRQKDETLLVIQRCNEVTGKSSEAASALNGEIARLTSMLESKEDEIDKVRRECTQRIDDIRVRHDEELRRKIGDKQLQYENITARATALEKEKIELRNKMDKENGDLRAQIDKLSRRIEEMSATLSSSDVPKIEFFLQESAQVLNLLQQAATKAKDIKAALRNSGGISFESIRMYSADTLVILRDCASHLEKTLSAISSDSQRHHLGLRSSIPSDADSQEKLARLRESYAKFWQELDVAV